MADLAYLTIPKAHELLKTGQISCEQLTRYYLDRIEQLDPRIQAVLTVNEAALETAKALDLAMQEDGFDDDNPLFGIPFTAKDMFVTGELRTTAGSKILEPFMPPAAYSATVVGKLTESGAILLAKVNQDEFGHGASTENSAFHPTKNPWDLSRVPGGSSGGSAAAVAADLGIFSIGTDTGGSIRQPSALCGVVGLKPTYGLVSRYGVVAMASSLDCIGPLARSVEDAAIVLEAMAGRDPFDATTIAVDDYHFSAVPARLDDKKIGVIREYVDGLDADNRAAFDASVQLLRDQGAAVSDLSLPQVKLALPAYYIVTPSEISSNLSRYDGIRYGFSDRAAVDLKSTYDTTRGHGFGDEAKRRIMIGTYALSAGYYDAYYKKAMQVRTLIRNDFESAFAKADVLIGPTTPQPAFEFGSRSQDPVAMYQEDVMTVAANLAGIPAITVPGGSVNGLPVGLQVMGPQTGEAAMFAVARGYDEAARLSERRPAL